MTLCEVGDLSNKWGVLAGTEAVGDFNDLNLPLFGSNTILGRSVTIHLGDQRWACATIQFDMPSVVEEVAFDDGVTSGTIRFEQAKAYPNSSPTTVLVDVEYVDGSDPSVDHMWHVHESAVTDGDCASAGGHYNPLGAPNTCSTGLSDAEKLEQCELGDLTGKLGTVDVPTVNLAYGDANLPLSGPYGIAGRSVVLHAAAGAGTRLSCGSLVSVVPELRAVAYFEGYGSIHFTQSADSSVTTMRLDLSGLPAGDKPYHVHVSPVVAGEAGDTHESCVKTNGHFNPYE